MRSLVLAALAALGAAHAIEPPDLLWSRTFASVDTSVEWIQQTADGGFVVAGSVIPNRALTPSDVDIYLLKLDSRGYPVWQDTYSSGETHDYALSVQQTSDGGFVIAGMGGDASGVIILKTDSTGTQEWRFAGYPLATVYSIQQTADGGYVTAGLWGDGDSLYLLKLDAQGGVAWRRSYNEFYGHWWTRIPVQQTSDGGYIVAAEALLKTDWQGNLQWKHEYQDVRVLFSVEQTSDGGYIAAGIARAPWPMGIIKLFNMVLLKTDAVGNLSWKKVFTAGQQSAGRCARQILGGGYVLVFFLSSCF
jgi:hypothetical protein